MLGAEYFVSTEGSDDGVGTFFTPLKTLSHAVQQLRNLRPGNPKPANEATLILRGGVYYMASEITLGTKDYTKLQV